MIKGKADGKLAEGRTHLIPLSTLCFSSSAYPFLPIVNTLRNPQEASVLYRHLGRGGSNGREISRKKGDRYTRKMLPPYPAPSLGVTYPHHVRPTPMTPPALLF